MTQYELEWGDSAIGEQTGAILCARSSVRRLSECIQIPPAEAKQLLLPLRCQLDIPSGSTLWNRVDLFRAMPAAPRPSDNEIEDIFERVRKSHWQSAGLLLDCPEPESGEWFLEMTRVFGEEFSEVIWRTQVATHTFLTKYQRLITFENKKGLLLPNTTGTEAYQCFVYEPPKPGSRKKQLKVKSPQPQYRVAPLFPRKTKKKQPQRPKLALKVPAVTDVLRTSQLRQALYAVYKGTCQMCHRHEIPLNEMEVDHVIPVTIPMEEIPNLLIAQGVKPKHLDSLVSMLPPHHHSAPNYQPVCGLCNSKKSNALLASGNLELRLRTARERAEEVLQWYARQRLKQAESLNQRYLFVDE